ncbi:polysaccharide pyruvyl transferase family protein [Skermanella sp. TT6]|nr:polysaccharide pyruvyl transferase family protein [Skermanella sp. TT6]
MRIDPGPETMAALADMTAATVARIPRDRPIVFVDYPVHLNIGDLLIHHGTDVACSKAGIRFKFQASAYTWRTHRRRLPEDAVIVLHGGGNFGDVWPDFQAFREQVLVDAGRRQVIMMPQSMHFSSPAALEAARKTIGQHRNLTMFLRDNESFEAASRTFDNAECLLAPDMAHALWASLDQGVPSSGEELVLMRNDHESVANRGGLDWIDLISILERLEARTLRNLQRIGGKAIPSSIGLDAAWINFRNRLLHQIVGIVGRYKSITTDRLHAMIIGTLMGKPVFAYDNSYGKLSRYSQLWLIPELDTTRLRGSPTPASSSWRLASALTPTRDSHKGGIVRVWGHGPDSQRHRQP